MSSNIPILEQSTLTVRFGERQLLVDFGELLFPTIALLFSTTYYIDTRGLPEQSMMYAKWLLYVTVALAIIAVFRHAVSVQSIDTTDGGSSYGALDNEALDTPESPQDGAVEEDGLSDGVEADSAAAAVEETEESGGVETNSQFNLRTSIGLAILTAGYILLLNFTSFVIASGLFLAAALYMFGERNPIRLVVYSIGIPLVIWAVFIRWLLVPLP